MLSVPHLDREFDYLVSADQSDDAQPGVRVRVRFHGRLVDAFVLERRSDTDHVGKLGWLDKVVSAERVLTYEVRRLVDAVAARYAGTRADVLRLAVPPRPANVEKKPPAQLGHFVTPQPDTAGWTAYSGGTQFIAALQDSRAARAIWQALPGESWAHRLAEAAAVTVGTGRGVLAVVPDQRDVDLLHTAAVAEVEESWVVALSAGLGPAERYRRWLSVLRGDARLVIGTRSAVFAPVADLGLVIMWDDGDDSLAEPRAPYPHSREVAMLRAHQVRCAALLGGYARTAEAQALVRSGWAHDLAAPRQGLRARAPRVVRWKTAPTRRSEIRPHALRGSPRWRWMRRARRSQPVHRCWCRFPGAVTCLRWRVDGAAPSPDAGTAPVRCRCPVATPLVRSADGAAVKNWSCAAPDAVPRRFGPSSSEPAEPPRNWGGRSRGLRSSPPAVTPWSSR